MLSIPPITFFLFSPHLDKGGVTHSDWSDLIYYLNQGVLSHWIYWREIVFWSVLVPLILGWVAHSLLVIGWQAWRKSASPR